jgi:hypothetical protein
MNIYRLSPEFKEYVIKEGITTGEVIKEKELTGDRGVVVRFYDECYRAAIIKTIDVDHCPWRVVECLPTMSKSALMVERKNTILRRALCD